MQSAIHPVASRFVLRPYRDNRQHLALALVAAVAWNAAANAVLVVHTLTTSDSLRHQPEALVGLNAQTNDLGV
jgi:hypothetical protein